MREEYAYYNRQDELVMTGTLQEIADEIGISKETVKFYSYPTYRKRTKKGIRVVKIDELERVEWVNVEKIKHCLDEYGYTYTDLAEILELSYQGVKNRMAERTRFTRDEIELLEDLFFLDEGELIKE